MNDVLLAKLITNNTDERWAHIHTTHNLFIVFALHDDTKSKSTLSYEGKKLLERIQREYYALDDKNLTQIKDIVQKCFSELPPHIRFSGVITALSGNTIYIITAGIAYAVMRRGNRQGVVAAGMPGEIVGFSGKLEKNDVIILETDAFAQRLSPNRLKELLSNAEFPEIHDLLHPSIHTDPKGGEAAIILHYTASQLPTSSAEPIIHEAIDNTNNDKEYTQTTTSENTLDEEEKTEQHDEEEDSDSKPTTYQQTPFLWRKFLPIGVIVLIIILGITLFALLTAERINREKSESARVYEQITSDAQKKYDEALALLRVNGNLGREKLEILQSSLEKDKNKLNPTSEEYKKLEAFISEIRIRLKGAPSGTQLPEGKVIFDKKDFDTITDVRAVSVKGGQLMILDGKTGNVLVEGKIYESGIKNALYISFNADRIFITNKDTIGYIEPKTNNIEAEQARSADTITSMDSFLGNVYVATDGNTIDKYESDSNTPKAYFAEDVNFDGITSISIDGSIWLTTKDGAVHKYTRGKKDPFTLANAPKMGSNLSIYTDQDYLYIYLLDKKSKTVHVFKKNGDYVNSFVAKIGTITSFAVLEASGTKPTLYLATSNKVLSYELPL